MSEWGRMQEVLYDELDRQGIKGVDVNGIIEAITNVRGYFPVLLDGAAVTPRTLTNEELAASWERESDELQAEYDRGELRQRNAQIISVLRSCALELREYGTAAQTQADEAVRLLRAWVDVEDDLPLDGFGDNAEAGADWMKRVDSARLAARAFLARLDGDGS